jgi:nicotinamidase-related amidase
MLNDFVLEGSPLEVPDTRSILPAVQREVERARIQGRPVIFVCDRHSEDDQEFRRFGWPPHAVRGTMGAEVVSELAPAVGDIFIEKMSYSGFYGTELEETLERLGVDSLRITGCVTHICILFTASDAVLRGFHVVVPSDCVAGLAPEDHEAALRIMRNVLSVDVL